MITFLGRTQPLAHYPILDCLSVIRHVGFDGVEICLENEDMAPEKLDDRLIGQVREQVEALGLAPHSVSYHKDYIYDDAFLEQTLHAIRLTPRFGTNLFVFAGTRKRTRDQTEWQRMIERTWRLVHAAEEAGVVLAEEFEPDFIVGCTAELLRLLEEIPSPALAVNLDLGHVFLCDPDPLQSIRELGPRIVHGHIENMKTGVHNHLLPQEGDMDLAAYLRTLAEVGFQGGLALDLYKIDYEAVAGECLAYLRGLQAEG